MSDPIVVKLVEFFQEYSRIDWQSCDFCSVGSQHNIQAYGEDAELGAINVCPSCLKKRKDEINSELEQRARRLEEQAQSSARRLKERAKALRAMIGRLQLPIYEEWEREQKRYDDEEKRFWDRYEAEYAAGNPVAEKPSSER